MSEEETRYYVICDALARPLGKFPEWTPFKSVPLSWEGAKSLAAFFHKDPERYENIKVTTE